MINLGASGFHPATSLWPFVVGWPDISATSPGALGLGILSPFIGHTPEFQIMGRLLMSLECIFVCINLINPDSVDVVGVLNDIESQTSGFVVLCMTRIFFYSSYKLFFEAFLDLDWHVNYVH